MPEIETQITNEEQATNKTLTLEERRILRNQLLQERLGPVMQALQLYKAQNSSPGILSIRPAP